jgi:hypothetical protein
VFGYTPRQVDELTVAEFNSLVRYLMKRREAQGRG